MSVYLSPLQQAALVWSLGLPFETYGIYQAFKYTKLVDPMELCDECRHTRRTLLDTMGTVQSTHPFAAWLLVVILIALWPGRIVYGRIKWVMRGFKWKHSCVRNFRRGRPIREGAKEG